MTSHALHGTTSSSPPRAAQACTSCRRQKRRCDKALPSCARCASLQRTCDYNAADAAAAVGGGPTAEAFAALQTRLADIEARLVGGGGGGHGEGRGSSLLASTTSADDGLGRVPRVGTNRFPSVLFLDIDTYKFSARLPPRPVINIPAVSCGANVTEDGAFVSSEVPIHLSTVQAI